MSEALGTIPAEARRSLVRRSQPEWISPMLATLTERRFSDPGWVFERKFDGVRCLAFREGRSVRLLSRNRRAVNAHYPEIDEALRGQAERAFVVDGEIVAFEGRQTSFARLQQRMQIGDPDRARRTGVAVFFYAFDVLHVGGYELTRLELRHRKAVLRLLLRFTDPLRFTVHRNGAGETYWREACRKGWEGVIAKRADAVYQQRRSGDWLKFKCVNEQEFVIGGFTDPQGSRRGFGALLVGTYRDGELVYAGKVGTGFAEQTLAGLRRRLGSIEQPEPPFGGGALPKLGVHWVRPELVGQIGFTEWTRDGQLRHPRFLGLREDKDPHEVVRERPT